ncbi:envelope glycoprotein, partial [Sigmodon hispidus]
MQNAAVISKLSESVATALEIQETLNRPIHFGILSLNQQVSLLKEQMDALHLQQRLSCDLGYPTLCVTPMEVLNASGQLRKLNAYISGPWNATFLNYTLQLVHAIVKINETRVTPIEAATFWNKLAIAAGWVQRWARSVSLLVLCGGGLLGILYIFCKCRQCRKQQHEVIKQALMAMQPSPQAQVWVSVI